MAAYVEVRGPGNITGFVRLTEIREWQLIPARLAEQPVIRCINSEGDELIPAKIFYIDKSDEIREFDVPNSNPNGLFALLLELE